MGKSHFIEKALLGLELPPKHDALAFEPRFAQSLSTGNGGTLLPLKRDPVGQIGLGGPSLEIQNDELFVF